MIWLLAWLIANLAIPTGYGLMRAAQKRRETYNYVFIA